jgi:GWxTD domain-containing protein
MQTKRDINKWLIFMSVVLFSFPLLAQEENPTISEKSEKWIKEEVVYIITPKERAVFKKLETDKERGMFIEEFWRHRDPTPGTPRNEFKEEHFRRIEYANKNFGRYSPFDGWATERGRYYIILGEPEYTEKHMDYNVTHPMEIWYYQGKPQLGQAPFFRLTFFRRHGVGDYELYSPLIDGPKALVPAADLRFIAEVSDTATSVTDVVETRAPTREDRGYNQVVDKRDRLALEILMENNMFEIVEVALSSIPGRSDPSEALPSVTPCTLFSSEISSLMKKK